MIRIARISPTLMTSTLSWFDCTAAIVMAVSSAHDTARRLASTLMVVSYGRCSCTEDAPTIRRWNRPRQQTGTCVDRNWTCRGQPVPRLKQPRDRWVTQSRNPAGFIEF